MYHLLDTAISGKWERIPSWLNFPFNFVRKEVILREKR